jgi:hypothetical protein
MRKGGASKNSCSSGVEALERQANDAIVAESSAFRAEEIVEGQNLLQLSRRRLHGSVVRTQIGVREFFSSPHPSRPTLESKQPDVQWIRGAVSGGHCGRGVALTTRPHLAPGLRMG